jgi:Icc protein
MLIAQLSDPHICPEGALYQGVADSNGMFAQALAHLHRLDRRPDLIALTGDVADTGSPEEYAMARHLFSASEIPFLVIPGNHDERGGFRRAFNDHAYLPVNGPLHWCMNDHPVRIIGLDSCPPGHHHGAIDAEGIRWLAEVLAQDRVKPTLVLLHHPPFASGIPYLDAYRYLEADALEAVVAAAPNVERVLCGHVHRTILRQWAGTLACTCPSTVTEIDLQLSPTALPSSHVGARGYLLHLWQEASGFTTHQCPIGDFRGPFAFA